MQIKDFAGACAQKLLGPVLALAMLPAFGQAASYTFTPFRYPSADTTVFSGIDDSSRIVGWSNTGSATEGFFVTAAGTLATLHLPGWDTARPTAINKLSGVVGQLSTSSTFGWFEDNANGFMQLSLVLNNQDVTGINGSYNMVGNFTSPSLQNAVYAYINGGYHTLLPANRCLYTHDPAINDSNVVVGNCVTSSFASMVFTWSNGHYTFLTTPSNIPYIQATGINKAGVIAGWYNDVNGFSHGFTLNGSVFTTVDYPGAGSSNTQILGINAAGKIVGTYQAPALTAFSAVPQ